MQDTESTMDVEDTSVGSAGDSQNDSANFNVCILIIIYMYLSFR